MEPEPSGSGQGQGDAEPPLPGFASITQFSNEGVKKLLAATRAFQSLPSAGPAWDLQKSYPQFNRAMRNARGKIVPMIVSLLGHANISADEFRFGDIDEKFEFLVEANDDMLERIGHALDEASGMFKRPESVVVNPIAVSALRPPGLWGKRKAEQEQSGPEPEPEVEKKMSNREIKKAIFRRTVKEKPQAKFKTPVDNSTSPFVPKLKEKPNSLKPLSILPEYNSRNEEFYGHPYFVELSRWEPNDTLLTKVTPVLPRPVDETPLIEINTIRDIEQLLRELYPVSELAIDLEHHAYRSFLGLTCLMQISTREKDYIIDTLALRDHLYHLNEIFTNPKVVKVFHGSSSDIEWLQKDLGLYVVNMFDTQVAAKVLGFPQLGLQSLLDKYCGVTQNKAFQLADWRIRPLPKEMIQYARQDTHCLLYIYDMLRNELVDGGHERNNLLLSVYDQSKVLCLKRYEKPLCNPKLSLRKMRRSLNNRQLYAFEEIYKWRDTIAREKDESIAYVLPNHMLIMICEQLPKEMTGIFACCDPVPPLVQSNIGTIHKIVTTAREMALQEHGHEEKTEKRRKLKDWLVLLDSVHDISVQELLGSKQNEDTQTQSEYEDMEHDNGLNRNTPGNQNLNEIGAHDVLEWPIPLRIPEQDVAVLSRRGSMCFNSKVKSTKRISRVKKESKDAGYSIDSEATPFERYQLSQEILDILKDPTKKDLLDMENPVVKAVYETVFCDAEDLEKTQLDQPGAPLKLDKVFDQGEFVPFNPLVSQTKPQRKRKRKDDTWDDNPNTAQDPSTGGNPNPTTVKMEPLDLDELYRNRDMTDSQTQSPFKEFISVPNVPSAESDKKKGKGKNKKGKGILNKLKAGFSRRRKGKKGDDNTGGDSSPQKSSTLPRELRSTSKRNSPKNARLNQSTSSDPGGSQNGKRKGKNKSGKGKGKFFDFNKRSGGSSKSVTFK